MKKINTLLIDDEISALKTLYGMLQQFFPQIHVTGQAQSVDEALLKVKEHEPELVFLDISMPPFGTGFDFLKKCPDRQFGVIFVTAHPQYAVKAINDAQPWAYLVKPYSVQDLSKAIQIAENEISRKDMKHRDMLSIVIPDARKGNVVIRVRDILYCRADGSTTDLFFMKDDKMVSFTASRTLKDIEEQLPPWLFFRSHHSYLVNLDFVERYKRTGRNGVIFFSNGEQAQISVSKMEEFEQKLSDHLHLS